MFEIGFGFIFMQSHYKEQNLLWTPKVSPQKDDFCFNTDLWLPYRTMKHIKICDGQKTFSAQMKTWGPSKLSSKQKMTIYSHCTFLWTLSIYNLMHSCLNSFVWFSEMLSRRCYNLKKFYSQSQSLQIRA